MNNKNWTTENIGNLTGKNIIVTGGNSGLGYEAVKALSMKGAKVILACRNIEKGEHAKKSILEFNKNADIVVSKLDLSDLDSIHQFSNQYKSENTHLNVLINNAGIMMPPYELTKDGFESQVGTNHLGHFALTGLLLDVLKNTPNSRVVNVSSIAHKNGRMNFDNLLYTNGKDYTPMKAYGRSKLANLLFTFELQRFFEKNNMDCIAVAAHPGVSDTNLFKDILPNWVMSLLKPIFNFMIQPAYMGALPELRAAIDLNVKGAEYYGPDGRREMKGYPILVNPMPHAQDIDDAKKLWDASEKLTKVYYK